VNRALEKLNSLSTDEATAALLNCCGCQRWANAMVVARPFRNEDELHAKADEVWLALEKEDWLEAFQAHPKIGEKKIAAAPSDFSRWSEQEQAGAEGASSNTQTELAEANQVYHDKFGYIYIVCATGKTADEMLALLHQRLNNDPKTELNVAAEEQRRITHLRLDKLLKK
jgi:OHCU decarboxylase